MRIVVLWLFAAFAALCGCAVASEVPPLTAAELDPAASAVWGILAGQGPIGIMLFGVVALAWKFVRPYLEEWAAARKLDRLMSVAEMGVVSVKQTYVDAVKEASADGKLTEEEARRARSLAFDAAVAISKTHGVDIVKEYGIEVINWAIEFVVGKMGIESRALKAVAVPLSALASPPIPEL